MTMTDEMKRLIQLQRTNKWRANNRTRALELDRKAKRATKLFISSLKNSPCVDCGIQYPPYIMHFDHLPGRVKEFNISNPRTTNRGRILQEVAKCELVCANCHASRTHFREKDHYDYSRISN